MLSHLLHQAGIACIVLEHWSHAQVQSRIRAGVLKQITADLLRCDSAWKKDPLGEVRPWRWTVSRRKWHWLRSRGDKTLADLARYFGVHPNQITAWKAQLKEGAAGVFEAEPSGVASPPVVDLKLLHAKIGELALENDLLSGARSKAGLLSAER